jgi:hypothetical protein
VLGIVDTENPISIKLPIFCADDLLGVEFLIAASIFGELGVNVNKYSVDAEDPRHFEFLSSNVHPIEISSDGIGGVTRVKIVSLYMTLLSFLFAIPGDLYNHRTSLSVGFPGFD